MVRTSFCFSLSSRVFFKLFKICDVNCVDLLQDRFEDTRGDKSAR